jgi:lipopolysaccharide/colanic/teichoic acid biosynthesis glycosyltransferase
MAGVGAELPPLSEGQWERARRLLVHAPAARTAPGPRLAERLLALLGLALTAPLLLLFGWLIRREAPGPLLYRQVRIGAAGRPFELFKLRTMEDGAHARFAAVAATHNDYDDPRFFKAYADPRVTPSGAVARALAVDEIPQLLNVVRGEMALVGPRPLIPEEDRWVEGWAAERRSVPPGLTGLWQTAGGNEIGFDGMLWLDCLYATHRGLRQDLRLVLATPRSLLGRLGRWRGGSRA